MLGLDYASVEPLNINLSENDMIILSGKKETSRRAFVKYMIHMFLEQKFGDAELYVLDSMAGSGLS